MWTQKTTIYKPKEVVPPTPWPLTLSLQNILLGCQSPSLWVVPYGRLNSIHCMCEMWLKGLAFLWKPLLGKSTMLLVSLAKAWIRKSQKWGWMRFLACELSLCLQRHTFSWRAHWVSHQEAVQWWAGRTEHDRSCLESSVSTGCPT